jgi:hypothetical protein
MCLIDNADPPAFYVVRHRTARKPWWCSECQQRIEPGERYEHVVGKWDDVISTFRTCAGCEKDADWLTKECGGYSHGGVYEELMDHWYDVPSLSLGRAIVRMRRRCLLPRNGAA